MPSEPQPPTEQEWRELYSAANAYKQLAPWAWMLDDDMFAIEDPETKEVGYVSVMGHLGEHLALGLYLGAEGLLSIDFIRHLQQPDLGALFVQRCLMASFEDRDTLSKQERDQIKGLGLKYRGRQSWPQFLDYAPGYVPWYLSGPQARFLTVALQQSCDVAQRFKDDSEIIDGPDDDQVLMRVLQDGVWQDRWHTPNLEITPEPIPVVDTDQVQRIRAANLPQQGNWESSSFFTLQEVQDEQDNRPYYLRLMMLIDPVSQIVFPPEISNPVDWRSDYQMLVLETIEQAGVVPESIAVLNDELRDLLAPIADTLGFTVIVAEELPSLEMIANQIAMALDQWM